jgi:hypothetical protein
MEPRAAVAEMTADQPLVLTLEMAQAGAAVLGCSDNPLVVADAVYRAMWAARPDLEPGVD